MMEESIFEILPPLGVCIAEALNEKRICLGELLKNILVVKKFIVRHVNLSVFRKPVLRDRLTHSNREGAQAGDDSHNVIKHEGKI